MYKYVLLLLLLNCRKTLNEFRNFMKLFWNMTQQIETQSKNNHQPIYPLKLKQIWKPISPDLKLLTPNLAPESSFHMLFN